MTAQTENQFVYKDSNIMRWAGLIFLILSPLVFFLTYKFPASDPVFGSVINFIPWLFLTISIMMILFSANLTITADKSAQILRLRYGFLLFGRTANIPFNDIADIQSQESVNNRNAEKRGYRLVAVLKDGRTLPFRSYFTRHDNKKQAAVDLRFAVTGSRHSDVPKVKSAGASLTI